MTTIRIVFPDFNGIDPCKDCLTGQFIDWRNTIKERWNHYNNDGKKGTVELSFGINPRYLWEPAFIIVAGNPVCLTHYFINLNKEIEVMAEQRSGIQKPRIELPGAAINPRELRAKGL